jgi:UDP-N-acetylenolpyruvoylglucosamine reductase
MNFRSAIAKKHGNQSSAKSKNQKTAGAFFKNPANHPGNRG